MKLLSPALAALLLAAIWLSPAGAAPRVRTAAGMVEGTERVGIATFKGIP